MRQVATALVLLRLLAGDADAAAKLKLRDSASLLLPRATNGWGMVTSSCMDSAPKPYLFKLATTAQGNSEVVQTWFPPASSVTPCWGQKTTTLEQLWWVTAPISSSACTLAGNIDFSFSCSESDALLNATFRFSVYRWDKGRGGIDPSGAILTSAASGTECPTALALRTVAAAAPTCPGTACSLQTGDRLVIMPEMVNFGTFGPDGVRSMGISYAGFSTLSGDTFANFVDTNTCLTFSADTSTNPTQMVGN